MTHVYETTSDDDLIQQGKALSQCFDMIQYEQFRKNQVSQEPSCLSERVYHMLYDAAAAAPNEAQHGEAANGHCQYLTSVAMDGTLVGNVKIIDWNAPNLPKKKHFINDQEPHLRSVTKASIALRPIIEHIHQTVMHHQLMQMSSITLEVEADIFSYFPHFELLDECLKLYQSGEYWLCFALGITLFERAVGDILLHSQGISDIADDQTNLLSASCDISTREMKINDILTNPLLETFIGEDVVFVIRCFTGPIQSLNLRNLLWHGFLGLDDFEPSFASFLFVLIFSVGSLPSVRGRTNVRQSIDIDLLTKGIQVPLVDFEEHHMIDILQHSFFISQQRLPDWKKAVNMFLNGKYYYSLVLLLPLLEHSLRRLFGHVNNCPDRIHCAETDLVYTTFDEMLDPQLDENAPNKLYAELGQDVILSLFDFLFWKDGPRVRDKLAHGTLDPETIPRKLAQMVLNCCLFLCYKYSIFPPEEQPSVLYHVHYETWYKSFINYELLFHPATLLVEDMFQCHKYWCDFHEEFVVVGKNTEKIQREMQKTLVKMVEDEQLCLDTIKSIHNQIVSSHSTLVLFERHIDLSQVQYHQISKRPLLPTRFAGKVGNCLSPGLSGLYVLRKTVSHIQELIQHIQQTFVEYMHLIENRKAVKKHRMTAAKLIYNVNHFSMLIQMLLSQVHLLHLESFNENFKDEQSMASSEHMRHICLGFTKSLQASLVSNCWDKVRRNMVDYMRESMQYQSS